MADPVSSHHTCDFYVWIPDSQGDTPADLLYQPEFGKESLEALTVAISHMIGRDVPVSAAGQQHRQSIADQDVKKAGRLKKEGEYALALKHYQAALSQLQKIYDNRPHKNVLIILSQIGEVLEAQELFPQALAAFEEALQIHRDLFAAKYPFALAGCLQDVGVMLQRLGSFETALQKFEEAEKLCKDASGSDKSRNVAYALLRTASVFTDMGCYSEALSKLNEAIECSDSDDKIMRKVLCEKRHVLAMLKRYPEALALSEEVLHKQKQIGPTADNEIVESLKHIGCVLQVMERHKEASEKWREALQIQNTLEQNVDSLQKADVLNMMGFALQESGDYSNALEQHQQALRILENIFGNGFLHPEIIITLYQLATTLAKLNRSHEGRKHHLRAMELATELYSPGHSFASFEEVCYCSLRASAVVFPERRFRRSMYQSDPIILDTILDTVPKQLRQLIDKAQEKNIPVDDETVLVVKIYKNVGSYLRFCGRLAESKACLERAIELHTILYKAEEHAEVADCLERFAGVLRDLGDLKQAQHFIERAVEIRRKLCAEPFQQTDSKARSCLAASLDALGNLYRQLGSFQRAREHIELGLEMRKQLFPENHPDIVLSLNSLGDLLRQMGQFDQACSCYRNALRACGPNAHSLESLGHTLIDKGQPDEAMKCFDEALSLLQYTTAVYVPKGRQFVDIFESIGHCFGALGKYHQAIEKEQHACKIREHYFGKASYQVAASLCHIGRYLHRIGRYHDELEKYRQALAIQKNIFRTDHYVVADTVDQMGCCLDKLEQHSEAYALHQQALEIRKNAFHERHPLVADTLDNIGFCLSYMGESQLALDHFQQAYSIRCDCYEKDHPILGLSRSYIEACKNVFKETSQGGEEGKCLMSKTDFEELVVYARNYLENIQDDATIVLEKNPTGFVRVRLPIPEKFAPIMETLRLNFWVPQMKIEIVEAPHNHPRYFESMIIDGGYTHDLYQARKDTTSAATFVASRIFKASGQTERRNIFCVGKVALQCSQTVEVRKGTMISFPRSLIHQVVSTISGTMTINCVLKNQENRNHYDIFLPIYLNQDPQVDRDVLLYDESKQILAQMRAILRQWSGD